ncbi:MAG: hypothetical protein AB8H80_18170 [Planctomycetota bacterium]
MSEGERVTPHPAASDSAGAATDSETAPSQSPPPRRRHTAVFVVHGIGRPKPGETVDAIVDGLAARNGAMRASLRREELPMPDYRLRGEFSQRSFPCHVRRMSDGEHGGGDFSFFEVCWTRNASVPAIAIAAIELVRAWIGFLVGLRTVFHASRGDHDRPVYRGLLHCATFASIALIGPVYALNLLLLIAYAAHSLFHLLGMTSGARWFLLATGAVAAAIGIWRLAVIGERLGGKTLPERVRAACTTRWIPLRRPLWLSMIVAGFALQIDSLVCGLGWRECTQHIGFALLVSFGLAAVSLAATIVIYTALRVLMPGRAMAARLEAVTMCAALQFGLWVVLVPSLWWVLIQITPKNALGPIAAGPNGTQTLPSEMLAMVLKTDGVQWLLTAPVLLAAIATALLHRARPSTRLVLPSVVSWTLLLSVVLGALAFVQSNYGGLPQWFDLAALARRIGLNEHHGMFFGALLLAATAIQTGLRLADDVLGYLQKYTAGSAIRQELPIRSRFRRVVEHVHKHEEFDDVLILAHSQGTIIALDELAAREQDDINAFQRPIGAATRTAYDETFDARKAVMLTCGSPFEHVYQHYFPQHYPTLADDRWHQLRQRLHLWHNVYREHDYVGRIIQSAPGVPNFPINHCLGAGSHADYWSDVRWLRCVERLLKGEEAAWRSGSGKDSGGSTSSPNADTVTP